MPAPSSPELQDRAALAEELAARGHNLIITARRGEILNDLANALSEKTGVIVEVRAVDLADPGARDALCTELSERNISILCNNAGTATFGPIRGLDPAGERKQVQLNAVAVHDLTLAVLPGMLARGAGGILISGSAAGNSPIPNNATYAATKAFANTFLRVAARRAQGHRRARHVAGARPRAHRRAGPRGGLDRGQGGTRFPVDQRRIHRTRLPECVGTQQDARGPRHHIQGYVGSRRLRPPRRCRSHRGQLLQETRRLTLAPQVHQRGAGRPDPVCIQSSIGIDDDALGAQKDINTRP